MNHAGPCVSLLSSRDSARCLSETPDVRIIRYMLLLTLVTAPAFGADVYRTTAPDGTVSYSDRPQGDSSEVVFVNTPRPGGPAPQRIAIQ